MREIRVRIEGKGLGLLQHRFGVSTQAEAKSPKKKDQKQLTDNVVNYLYMNAGKVCQPGDHIHKMLQKCGAKFQIPGQRKLTYKNIIGAGAIQVEPAMIQHEIQDWSVDERAVIVNRGRIIRQRPYFPKWALSFNLIYDEDELSKQVIKDILEYAGERNGLGDYRPEYGGPFGKFMVTLFEET